MLSPVAEVPRKDSRPFARRQNWVCYVRDSAAKAHCPASSKANCAAPAGLLGKGAKCCLRARPASALFQMPEVHSARVFLSRRHPSLLQFPASLFSDGEFQVAVALARVRCCCPGASLPAKRVFAARLRQVRRHDSRMAVASKPVSKSSGHTSVCIPLVVSGFSFKENDRHDPFFFPH